MESVSKNKNKFNFKNILHGVALGVSNVIPGVSGGTVAVILGIYEKLISTINNLKSDMKSSIKYLFQIALGIGLGVLLFSNIITVLLDKYTLTVNYVFIGLVLGSIGTVYSNIQNKKFSISNIISVIIGFTLVFGISVIGTSLKESGTGLSGEISNFLLMFSGFMAAVAMLLPGVSGSLILVMIGVYDEFTNAIATFNIPYLFIIGIGVLLGLIIAVKLIGYCLKNFSDTTYHVVLGLIFGSVVIIAMANPIGTAWLNVILSVSLGFIVMKMIERNI